MGSYEADNCDVLVIGAGIFGTSTAYHLSQTHPDPSRITIIDRARVPSPEAASSDMNKIVRADYTNPFYMELAYEAIEQWLSWPLLRPYFHQTGWVMLDEKGSDVAERIRANFRRSGHPDTSESISLDEVQKRWGGTLANMDTGAYDKAYTNTSAGWADASTAVEALMNEALQRGVRFVAGDVRNLILENNKLRGVKTSDGNIHRGQKIVLASGAWTSALMKPLEQWLNISQDHSIDKQIQAAGVCVSAYHLSTEEAAHYSQMPVLVYGEQGEVLPPNNEQRYFKFTNSNTFLNTKTLDSGIQVSMPVADQLFVPARLKEESLDLDRRRIPEMLQNGRQPDYWRLCWDAVSPDQNQLICQHPDPRLENLFLATAGSFHSWKFLPIIGKYVVNVLNGKSNGPEKDVAWQWKTAWAERGAHEKVLPKRELRDLM